MTSTDDKKSNQICLWCGKNIADAKSREHIFPECIGGKQKLPIGYVCDKCNNNFSRPIDEALFKGHIAMMDAYQVDTKIKRKGKKGKDKERYIKEKTEIQGIGEAKSTKINRENGNTYLINADYIITSENFVRSLHKCIANILCDLYGSIYVRKNYRELLHFVKNGGDARPWSYAVSHPNFFTRPLISEPQVLGHHSIKINDKTYEVISFIHTSGIWIVGSSPFLLNPSLIEKFSDSIITELAHKKERVSEKLMTDFFGFEWDKGKRNYIGKLKFLWVIKEIEGKLNNEFLYLLTRCKVCGQTNPTMLSIPRNKLLEEKYQYGAFDQNMNTWNYTKGGVPLELRNDVKKMKISNCKINCIGCNNLINFSADDCFI